MMTVADPEGWGGGGVGPSEPPFQNYSLSDGGGWSKKKLAFPYPVSQFSSDCQFFLQNIMQPLLSSHLATT